ncbi:MAG: TlyA family RNA methyltransferase [Candidatus Abyssobacteria bacterium SURF_17]|uniref:TlyA family RNA methyltransferase n=1 Tax=Candidatus Abyssobacteria bacterium SURF_17 TaxID=2093361 RepID=A0A419F051_9BACT|nr:MAG: TlyA family RNA methyltransferase [Candidatus Abyssubacteria bacterium SURF_17]
MNDNRSEQCPKTTAEKKDRLDKLLVEMNLVTTRARARSLILAGRVKVDSQVVDKAGASIKAGSIIEIVRDSEFASRGGEKLEHALVHFRIEINGKVVLDVGASTGGFTDCLLQHGARKVYAVDVGYGQLAWRLRNDPRVVVMERINARNLEPEMFPERPELAAIDVSFISLTLILPAIVRTLADEGKILALIKPQFEAGRKHVGKGGVVRDPAIHQEVVEKVVGFARGLGLRPEGTVESPLLGPAGNKEFFVYLSKTPVDKGYEPPGGAGQW